MKNLPTPDLNFANSPGRNKQVSQSENLLNKSRWEVSTEKVGNFFRIPRSSLSGDVESLSSASTTTRPSTPGMARGIGFD